MQSPTRSRRPISFGIGRNNRADDAPIDHPLFEIAGVGRRSAKRIARRSPRRRGSSSAPSAAAITTSTSSPTKTGALWVGVHFGSRGFGHTVASGFLALAQGKKWGERVPEREVLPRSDEPFGHDYWHLMNLAGEYAYAGREWVARKVVSILGGSELELVHNHHNFAWTETHDGEEVIVVRKGATPAFPGQKGFIGGSMGDDAVIRAPAPLTRQRRAARAHSTRTVHGAGRVMSRTEARGKINRKTGEVKSPGTVSREMMREWVAAKGVILRGGGLDESPHAYRRLPDVLAAQGATVEVLHTLRPLVVVMAGRERVRSVQGLSVLGQRGAARGAGARAGGDSK